MWCVDNSAQGRSQPLPPHVVTPPQSADVHSSLTSHQRSDSKPGLVTPEEEGES